MDVHVGPRQPAQRVVDLRRARTPDVAIVAWGTYDFLLSLHVVLASPDYDYADFDIGRAWIEEARRRCAVRDAGALATLGHYLGDGQPGSLHATLISLVALCPEPRDTAHFLRWLADMPAADFVEALLDQDGLGSDWPDLLHATLTPHSGALVRDETAMERLLERYPSDMRASVMAILRDPESARKELIAALRVWDEAVFMAERAHVLPLLEREAEALKRQRAELPTDRFIKLTMRGVEWQRPAGLRTIIFAPSYFCRPAVFYHFWRGVLTFCYPVDAQRLTTEAPTQDPRAPSDATLRFFEALGDATRLRILRLLAEREMYLTELSERLGLTKATTKHHMVRLRASGFVTLYDRDRMTYYALRTDIARRAAQLLDEYLDQSSQG